MGLFKVSFTSGPGGSLCRFMQTAQALLIYFAQKSFYFVKITNQNYPLFSPVRLDINTAGTCKL
jgi:hypothetical protein